MRLIKYVNDWIDPPKHSHPTEGLYGLDHPKARENMPKYTLCINPTCPTYERTRRQALIKACVVVVIWVIICVVMTLVVKYMRVNSLI